MVIHVVGAGIAGLSAATALLDAGADVRVHEAAPMPGGRCRSYEDAEIGRRIDTGTHLLLGANTRALAYLERIGARERMIEVAPAAYPFVDLASGQRWTMRPPFGGLLSALQPVALAALNTEPGEASWPLLAAVFGRLFTERACRPWIASDGVGDALVDPAVARLGNRLALGRRLVALDIEGTEVRTLVFVDDQVALGARDQVILAIPPNAAASIVRDLPVPTEHRAIVNAHFRVQEAVPTPRLVGCVGGLAQWLLWRGDVISVTVSAAGRLLGETPESLAQRLWPEVASAFLLDGVLPPWRVVKERRATIAATPAMERLRPTTRTRFTNLLLAGDWIRTGLPATIESAVRSGEAAARLAGVSIGLGVL